MSLEKADLAVFLMESGSTKPAVLRPVAAVQATHRHANDDAQAVDTLRINPCGSPHTEPSTTMSAITQGFISHSPRARAVQFDRNNTRSCWRPHRIWFSLPVTELISTDERNEHSGGRQETLRPPSCAVARQP